MAKFKAGDKVKIIQQRYDEYGLDGTVTQVNAWGTCLVRVRKGRWSNVLEFREEDLAKNSRVCNSKINVGDNYIPCNSTDPVVANAMAYAGRKANVVANSWVSHEHLGDLKKAMFYANIDYSRLEKEGLGMWSSREDYANKEFYRKNQHYLKAVEPFGQDKDIGQKAKAFASILKTAKPVKEDFRKLKDAAAELNDEVIRLTVGR